MKVKRLLQFAELKLQSWGVALLLITSAWLLAKITWLVIAPMPGVTVPSLVASDTQASSSAGSSANSQWREWAQAINQRAFFGEPEAQQVTDASSQIDAPETRLKLSLLAILAASDRGGFAIIGQSSSSGKVFQVGDNLFGQAVLSAVYSDRVIIERGGVMETLYFEKTNSSSLATPVPERPVIDSNAESLQQALTSANQAIAQGADVTLQTQGVLGYVEQAINEDPQALLNELGLEVTDQGYQVSRRARQLLMVGLRPGDIITAVNNTPVGNISQDQQLLNQLMSTGGQVSIEITRGSRTLTIHQEIPAR
ncbi:type II secretion system protein N [Reinekea thalattae]|uniref:PDZ domain-containing protein n=1 Tax=Reinekea thalattae TaxID=2593301 RepID=A0A5C8Z8T7_9GAMM|nr:type II secretion system protein N [Reinekea thalattae]TXR53266.1 hypothetical protein FME95_01450 [Reinekea thalattae]